VLTVPPLEKRSRTLFASITAPLSTGIKLPGRVWKPTASAPDEHSWSTVGNWQLAQEDGTRIEQRVRGLNSTS